MIPPFRVPWSPESDLVLLEQLAGETWEQKVKKVREKLQEKNAHGVVVSALDELACKSSAVVFCAPNAVGFPPQTSLIFQSKSPVQRSRTIVFLYP